jgi:hypothetical protein
VIVDNSDVLPVGSVFVDEWYGFVGDLTALSPPANTNSFTSTYPIPSDGTRD